MANRILVSTENLEKAAVELDGVRDVVVEVSNMLAGANMSQECGGDLRFTSSILAGNTAAEITRSLNIAMRKSGEDIGGLSAGLRKSAEIFAEAEKANLQLASGIRPGSNEEKGQGSAENIQRELQDSNVQAIINSLESAERNIFPNMVDWQWIKKNAYGGLFFTIVDGKINQLSNEYTATHMVDHILDMYGQSLLDPVISPIDQFNKLLGFTKDGCEVGVDIRIIAGGEKALANEKKFKEEGVFGEVFKTFGEVKKGTELYNDLMKAYDFAYRLSNMDPATAQSLRAGLLQNGDTASKEAAAILAMAGDPAACASYGLMTFAGGQLNDAAKDLCKEALKKTPTGQAVSIGISVGTIASDMTMSTTETATKAQYAMSIDAIRRTNANAVRRAVAEYQANPSSDAYAKVQSAYQSYNTVAAESVDACRDTLQTAKDSLVGKHVYSKEDFSYLEEIRDGFIFKNNMLNDASKPAAGMGSR